MTTVLLIVYIMMHLTVGGYSYSKIQAIGRPKCKYGRNCDTGCGHSMLAGLSVLIWPVVIPVAIGSTLGKGDAISRTERRRQKELEEARHKKELARIAMEEDALLTHQLESINRRR